MEISRQHETTTIPELAGAVASNLLGIGAELATGFVVFYLLAGDEWYRFFVDRGILFWVTSGPDPEDDLAEGEEYADIFELIKMEKDLRIKQITMINDCLTIEFENDSVLRFHYSETLGATKVTLWRSGVAE